MSPEAQDYLGEVHEYWKQQYASGITAEGEVNWRKHLDDLWYALSEGERYATMHAVIDETKRKKEQA